MRLVIADAGPVNYLVLIDQIELLSSLFGPVILPQAVRLELINPKAPPAVRNWIADPPPWLETRESGQSLDNPALRALDEGEKAAIGLALSLGADLLLLDDRDAVTAARGMGLNVTGTLGILDLAAEKGLIDFAGCVAKLARTSFRRPNTLLAALLKKHEGEQGR